MEGGVEDGLLFSEDDEVSDGNVAKVQYEPSDSPSLTKIYLEIMIYVYIVTRKNITSDVRTSFFI